MPISPEQLITELNIENASLKAKLEEAEQHIKDFEKLAFSWKEGYQDAERYLKIKIEHLEQITEELQKELDIQKNEILEWKGLYDADRD
jgi:hypothetical protein